MGGPMSYARLIGRNGFTGWGYTARDDDPFTTDPVGRSGHESRYYMEGEFRRFEDSQLNAIDQYAAVTGLTEDQVGLVLRTVLGIPEPGCDDCARGHQRERGSPVSLGRCHAHAVYGRW